MADKDTIFVLTREDIIECTREMGIPEETIRITLQTGKGGDLQ